MGLLAPQCLVLPPGITQSLASGLAAASLSPSMCTAGTPPPSLSYSLGKARVLAEVCSKERTTFQRWGLKGGSRHCTDCRGDEDCLTQLCVPVGYGDCFYFWLTTAMDMGTEGCGGTQWP